MRTSSSKPKYIEKIDTPIQDLWLVFYAFIVICALTAFVIHGGQTNPVGLALGGLMLAAVIVYAIGVHVYKTNLLNQRTADISALAAQNKWHYEARPDLNPVLNDSSLMMIANRDVAYQNGIQTADWIYGDISYAIYQQTKGGEYKSAIAYYATIAVQLPRILPNVVFDSKQAKGRKRQFRRQFARDELHHLEGNFDNYFDTYFAEGYTIDSMSFITPDVMQTLLDAAEYDIEIVRDTILMYGPMYDAAQQVNDMAAKILAIKKQIMSNVKAYDDQHLAGAAGRQTVAPQGMFLTRRKANAWVTLIGIGVYLIIKLLAIYSGQH